MSEAEFLSVPYYTVNTLTGTKAARVVSDPLETAEIIARARNPLYILGPETITIMVGERLFLEYALEIVKANNILTCATAHVKKKMLELGKKPDCVYDIIEIIHFLKMPDWQGIRRRGLHDLILFTGIRCDLAERGLATLKHFAPHLKTFAICRRGHPNADYTTPVILRMEKWQEYLEGIIKGLVY
jgi:acetyl-CoA decarbonylase/synthase complex subunit epsilon